MKKIFLYIVLLFIGLYNVVSAEGNYLFDSFENSPNKTRIELIKDEKTRYCEEVYLEAMYRRNFTKQEINSCKNIFIQKIKAEIDYKRRVSHDRYIY